MIYCENNKVNGLICVFVSSNKYERLEIRQRWADGLSEISFQGKRRSSDELTTFLRGGGV